MGGRKALLSALAFIAALGLAFVLFPKEQTSPEIYRETRYLMGTEVTIVFPAAKGEGPKLAAQAYSEAEAVDGKMGRRAGSELAALNGAGSGTPGPELSSVLTAALEWAKASGGAFDPTVASLIDLWAVEKGPHKPPTPDRIAQAMARTGWEKVRPGKGGNSIDLGGTTLDLGAIAKGYAVDRCAAKLKLIGVRDFIVDAGGDLYVSGNKGGKPWKVGLLDPRAPEKIKMTFRPREGAFVTSGDYERFFEWEGKRYGHILDPKTGMPAEGVESVTVWAENAMDADAMATAVFVLGPEKGLEFVKNNPPAEVLLIDSAGAILKSPGFDRVAPLADGGP